MCNNSFKNKSVYKLILHKLQGPSFIHKNAKSYGVTSKKKNSIFKDIIQIRGGRSTPFQKIEKK